MVLELKDKVGITGAGESPVKIHGTQSWRQSVGSALASLGWSTRESDQAMDRVAENSPEMVAGENPDISLVLKEALRSLDRS